MDIAIQDDIVPPCGQALHIQLAAPHTTGWTRLEARRYRRPMPHRNSFDALEPTHEPRWYTVRNMHGALLEARPLRARSDLKCAFVAAMLEWIDAG
jgi:hypothetical protein